MIDDVREDGSRNLEGDKKKALTVQTRQSELATDALKNTIAFRGSSADVLATIIQEVRSIGADQVYPAIASTNSRNPDITDRVSRTAHFNHEGRVSQPEAIAMEMLAMESNALYRAFAQDSPTNALIELSLHGELGLTDGFVQDVAYGIAAFQGELRTAASIRDGVIRPEDRKFTGNLEAALKKDRFSLGENVSKAAVQGVERSMNDRFSAQPAQVDIVTRRNSFTAGARFAQRQYMETLQIAQKLPQPGR